jgi:hypothetical protein
MNLVGKTYDNYCLLPLELALFGFEFLQSRQQLDHLLKILVAKNPVPVIMLLNINEKQVTTVI